MTLLSRTLANAGNIQFWWKFATFQKSCSKMASFVVGQMRLFWNRSNAVNCANFVWKCGRWSFSDRFPLSLRSISFYGIEWFQFTLLLIFSRNCSRFFQHYTHRQSRIFPSGIFSYFFFHFPGWFCKAWTKAFELLPKSAEILSIIREKGSLGTSLKLPWRDIQIFTIF